MRGRAKPEGDVVAEESSTPDDEFREMLRRFLSNSGADFDPAALAGAAGLPVDPSMLAAMMQQLQSALNRNGQDGIDWSVAGQQATTLAREGMHGVSTREREELDQAATLAGLWLNEVTGLALAGRSPKVLNRSEWAELTLPVWSEIAEPVASSIADALSGLLRDQLPADLPIPLPDPAGLMRSIGGVLFAMQLGQVIGRLSREVVSGGDVGFALTDSDQPILIAQNLNDFAAGLDDVEPDQVQLYLSVRELAHVSLFRHAKWLRLHLLSQIADFARGIEIDVTQIEDLAATFNPEDAEELRELLISGRLIPPRSEQQQAALARIETMLALVDGWVSVVTEEATSRLPRSAAIAEMVNRRRAVGGPAEHAFATLMGLELRPRRLREAAAMWREVGAALGSAGRDALWSHPDLVPTAEDIDDPAALIARLQAPADADQDAFDQSLEALLEGQLPSVGENGEGQEDGDSDEDDASDR